LGAVRRLAYEAADCGLLSSDLAARIRRLKGVKKLGVRLDPLTLGSASIGLIAVALVAFALPARQAARIDPMRALRME
jgi:ABC-type lipoprotein release transport system permease subunit